MTTSKENTGAWIIHHGRKLVLDVNGPAEFPAIDEAAKAATLLTKLGETNQATVSSSEVRAIAVASGLNPRRELNGLLSVLEKKRLVERSENGVDVLGVTTRASLSHAADMYKDAEPSKYEEAAISLAEVASKSPIRRSEASELISDQHQLTRTATIDFFDRAEKIVFVDREGSGEDRIFFNGNLFRRDSIAKTQKVLASLSGNDHRLVAELAERFKTNGCMNVAEVEAMLSKPLFEKLVAAGFYDLNKVANESGNHVYVTLPSAFHKFVDPMVDDTFDMAKALVAALTYGMTIRPSQQGRISLLPVLLSKLIAGYEIGPATAIGQDYRALEVNRVVQLRRDARYPDRYHMRLLKKEVKQLALHVLTVGNADVESLTSLPAAPMKGYVGPEESRTGVRRTQSEVSRKTTQDILEAVRGGRAFR